MRLWMPSIIGPMLSGKIREPKSVSCLLTYFKGGKRIEPFKGVLGIFLVYPMPKLRYNEYKYLLNFIACLHLDESIITMLFVTYPKIMISEMKMNKVAWLDLSLCKFLRPNIFFGMENNFLYKKWKIF